MGVYADVSELALNWALAAWISVQVSQLPNTSLADCTNASTALLSVFLLMGVWHAAITPFHSSVDVLCYYCTE